MNIQTHPGFSSVGIEIPQAARGARVRPSRAHVGRRTVTVLAAVAIELLVAVAMVAMAIGVGGSPRAVTARPDAAPFVTPAPEMAPTPRPGF